MWGLSSPTRDWTSTHCIREQGAFTFGIPGKSLVMPFSNIWDTQLFTQSNLSIFSFMIYSLSFLNRNFFSATPSGRHARSPGIKLTPPAVEAWSLNQRTTREVPVICSLKVQKVFLNPEVIKYLFHLQDFYCVIFFPHFTLVHLEFIFIYHARWGSKLIFSPKWLRHKPNWCDIMLLFNNSPAFFTLSLASHSGILHRMIALTLTSHFIWYEFHDFVCLVTSVSTAPRAELGIWQDLHI